MRGKVLRSMMMAVSLVIPAVLFAYVAYNSWGYDDEIFNIRHVESYDSIYSLMKDHLSGELHDGRLLDIHPLGQYVINYALLKALGSWSLVRIAGALIASLSLWLFWCYTQAQRSAKDIFASVLSYLLICLNPSAMLWCTGLRWYTYFMPLVCLIGILFQPPEFIDSRKYLFWGIYFTVASIMFYIETSAAIIILVSFPLLLLQRRATLKHEFATVLFFGLLSLAFVSRQIYILLTVIYPRVSGSSEFYSLIASFVGGAQNFLSGHAVIPVSIPGLILIAANFIIFIVFIMNIKCVMSSWRNKFFVLSYAGIIVAKIGGKIRNFINMSALLGVFIADVFTLIKNNRVKAAVLCMYLTGTAWGIHNVICHNETAKGSWNTPYSEIIEFLERYDPEKKYPVLAFDAVFVHNAEIRGFNVISAEKRQEWHSKVKDIKGPVIVLRTFKGSLTRKEYDAFNEYVSGRKILLEQKFGYDKFAGFKRLFDKECPDYYAVMLVTEAN